MRNKRRLLFPLVYRGMFFSTKNPCEHRVLQGFCLKVIEYQGSMGVLFSGGAHALLMMPFK